MEKDILKQWKKLTITMSKEEDVTILLVAPTIHKILKREMQMKDLDSEPHTEMKA